MIILIPTNTSNVYPTTPSNYFYPSSTSNYYTTNSTSNPQFSFDFKSLEASLSHNMGLIHASIQNSIPTTFMLHQSHSNSALITDYINFYFGLEENHLVFKLSEFDITIKFWNRVDLINYLEKELGYVLVAYSNNNYKHREMTLYMSKEDYAKFTAWWNESCKNYLFVIYKDDKYEEQVNWLKSQNCRLDIHDYQKETNIYVEDKTVASHFKLKFLGEIPESDEPEAA